MTVENRFLTKKEFIRLARKIVKGNEDFYYRKVNETCRYIKDDAPSCLIGQILVEWDPTIKKDLYIPGVNGAPVEILVSRRVFNTSEETLHAMKIMQNDQDKNNTWGQALNSGLRYLK